MHILIQQDEDQKVSQGPNCKGTMKCAVRSRTLGQAFSHKPGITRAEGDQGGVLPGEHTVRLHAQHAHRMHDTQKSKSGAVLRIVWVPHCGSARDSMH